MPVLKTIPFDKVDIKVLQIEITPEHHKYQYGIKIKQMRRYLEKRGFEYLLTTEDDSYPYDMVMVKKGYLDELNEL